MKKVLFLFFAAILLSPAAVSAQSSAVKGTVTETRIPGVPRPVGSLKVLLDPLLDRGASFETVTDGEGRYLFSPVPAGDYVLIAECAFCTGGSFRKELSVAAAATVRSDIELLRGIGTETVTISAGRVQSLEEVSKSISVIDGQQMRDRADFSLAEVLRTIPGFRVQQSGGFGRTAVIKARGLRNHDTAILIDGIRLRDVSSITGDASAFIGDITLTSVSRIEVLRGSGSSLYGTNAIGGTVDFQTPRAQSGWHGQAGGAVGALGFGRFRGNLSRGSEDGRLGFTTGASRTVYTRGIDGNDAAYNTNLQGRIDYSPTDRMMISVRGFFSDASVRLNSDPDTRGTLPSGGIIDAVPGTNFLSDAEDPDAVQRSRFAAGSLSLTRVFTDDLVFSANYSALRTRRRNDNGILGTGFQSASTAVYKGTVHTANFQLSWSPFRSHQVRAGYEYESERFSNDGFTPSGTGDYSTRAAQSGSSFYIQDLITLLAGRMQIAGSVRTQAFGLGDTRFSLSSAPYLGTSFGNPKPGVTFDGSVSYLFGAAGTKIRAHVGNGYRLPSLYERFGVFFSTWPSPSFVALGDPALRPERSISYDAGVEQSFSEGKMRLTATYFYTELTETIGYGYDIRTIPGVARPYGGYYNTKGGLARGLEFAADLRPTATTSLLASYSLTNSDQRSPQVGGSGTIETLGVPKNQFTVVANQRLGRSWVNFDLFASGRYLAPVYSGTYFRSYAYRFEGSLRGDLTVGHTVPLKRDGRSVRLFTTVENVFGDEYYENGFRTAGRTGRIGMSFGF